MMNMAEDGKMGGESIVKTYDLIPSVKKILGFEDLSVAFQPLVDLSSGSLFAYEALLRPNHPRFRDPVSFLNESIRLECIGELGRMIRSLAVARCPDFPLFLNVHPQELEEGWLLRQDDPIYRHPHTVFLEITEALPMAHCTPCMMALVDVRKRGVRIVVDDLGAGYSNLKYIADLEPAFVKIDRELTACLPGDRVFRLVRAITRMCVDLDAKVVVEGIETKEELDAARAAGVHFGQGFLIARPDPVPPQVTLDLLT
jgi:EAL domain-containing protein (putative c-di-GMP-specific phosphodiesterase class I)